MWQLFMNILLEMIRGMKNIKRFVEEHANIKSIVIFILLDLRGEEKKNRLETFFEHIAETNTYKVNEHDDKVS